MEVLDRPGFSIFVGYEAVSPSVYSRTLSFDIEMTMYVVLTKILGVVGAHYLGVQENVCQYLITTLGALRIPYALV